MLIQGDVRNLVPVKCFIKDDPEHKHKHIEFDDKVFDEDHAVNNLNLDPNPFQAGTDVSLDGDLIIQLWRDGKLDQYCRDFKFKQVLNTVVGFYFGTLQVRFLFSSPFWKLGLVFYLE